MEIEVSTITALFRSDGFARVLDMFPVDVVTRLNGSAMENFDEAMEIIRNNKLNLGIGIKEGFKELVQRHKDRFEMPFKMDSVEFDIVLKNERLMKIVRGILGEDAIVANRSLVISLSGSEDQAWHTDGPHVSMEEVLPCHCLNVFIPLIDVQMAEGPTEFRPGSQVLTRDLSKEYLAAFIGKRLRPTETPELPIGSVLLFDYRVLHRGKANVSDHPRPVLVFTFSKPWFKDTLNFPKRSLLHIDPEN